MNTKTTKTTTTKDEMIQNYGMKALTGLLASTTVTIIFYFVFCIF